MIDAVPAALLTIIPVSEMLLQAAISFRSRVADVHGNLDIFTTRHNAEQVIACGIGNGSFSPVVVALES